MVDYTLFNQYKAAGWKCNTKEDFEKWQETFREYWNELEFSNAEQKQRLLDQIKDLTAKKEAYFNKQGNRPVVNHYIFQPDLAAALTEYLKVLTEIKRKELQG